MFGKDVQDRVSIFVSYLVDALQDNAKCKKIFYPYIILSLYNTFETLDIYLHFIIMHSLLI